MTYMSSKNDKRQKFAMLTANIPWFYINPTFIYFLSSGWLHKSELMTERNGKKRESRMGRGEGSIKRHHTHTTRLSLCSFLIES